MQKYKVKDKVYLIAGKHSVKKTENQGQVAEILALDLVKGKVKLDIVTRKKFKKKSTEGPGEIIDSNPWISISNIAIVDPKTKKPSRVGIKVNNDGSKVRIAKKSGTVLDK